MPKYTKEDLLQRLNAGETVDNLGTEIADYLNTLAAQYTAELNHAAKAQDEAKAAASRAAEEKTTYAQMIAEDMSDFLRLYYPEFVDEKEDLFTGDDLIELLDLVKELMDSLAPLLTALGHEKKSSLTANTTSKNVSKAEIQKFLQEMGL